MSQKHEESREKEKAYTAEIYRDTIQPINPKENEEGELEVHRTVMIEIGTEEPSIIRKILEATGKIKVDERWRMWI